MPSYNHSCPPPQPPNPACKRQPNSIELNPSPLLLVVDYVEEIFQTFLSASNDDLKGAAAKLKQITPLPMNSMLERESKTDAIKKKTDRRLVRRLWKMSPLPHLVRKHIFNFFTCLWGKGLACPAKNSSMLCRDLQETPSPPPHHYHLQKELGGWGIKGKIHM